jgi:hypothetical protein
MKQNPGHSHSYQESDVTDAARAFLLGKLTDSEAERLESQLLADPQLFSEIEEAEDDLFDAFARGSLDADDRARFLERLGGRRDRRRFAEALARRATRAAGAPFWRQRWMQLAVAATLVLAAGVAVVRRDRFVPPPVDGPGETAASTPAPVRRVTRVLPLSPATSRSAEGSARLALDASVTDVELRIRLDPNDRFAVYAVELRSSSDQIVWGNATLGAAQENGDLVVHAMIPAARLDSGTYEVGIRGGDSAARLEDLGFSTIEVNRTK